MLSLFSCGKDKPVIENLNGNKISIIGHGGMGNRSLYPINSLESIIKCLEMGADGVEIDVQLTADSVLVAFHPKKMESITSSEGQINDKNWAEIREIDLVTASSLHYDIHRVVDVINVVQNYGNIHLILDCKSYPSALYMNEYTDIYILAMTKLIDVVPSNIELIIESQDTSFLNSILRYNPGIKTMFYPATFEEGYRILQETNYYGLTIDSKKISSAQVSILHQLGKRVALWNVSSRSKNKEAISKNPDYIQTDAIRNLINQLD